MFCPYPVCCLPNVEGNAPPLPGQPRVAGGGNDGALPSSGNVRPGGRTGLSHDGEAVVNVWRLRQTRFCPYPVCCLSNVAGNAPPLPLPRPVSFFYCWQQCLCRAYSQLGAILIK